MEQNQIAIPVTLAPEEIYRNVMRKNSLGGSIELCAELIGWDLEKTTREQFRKRGLVVDKAQFSRWKDGSEGIMWEKFEKMMDICGNDAPLLWMLYRRGYDLYSLRRRQTETERALEMERAKRIAAEEKLSFLADVVQGKAVKV